MWLTCATGFGNQRPESYCTVYHQKLTTWEVLLGIVVVHTSIWKQGDFCMILQKNPGACFFFVLGFFTYGNERNICVAQMVVARSHQVLQLLEERPPTLAPVCHLM